jgi:serine/threonine protein kinase
MMMMMAALVSHEKALDPRATYTLSSYLYPPGIAHRDLKPANILLTAERRLKICDLGLATFAGGAEMTLTAGNGTPGYMPPEGEATSRFLFS